MVDLYIAGGLVLIVIIVYLLSRLKLVTKKTLPYAVLGLLAALGFGYFKLRRMDSATKKIKEIKKEINKRKEKVAALENASEADKAKLKEIDAELDRKLTAHKKQSLMENVESKEEKERLKNLSDQELLKEFSSTFGSI
jgi:septal ring factor EnvC (AmiA/AmiB activator)